MQLFQRVKILAKSKAGSVKALAEKLGKGQSRFNAYLNETRQNNLWPLLPQILELYPDVSRDWLYFGEGEMIASSPTAAQVGELETELDAANAMLDAKDAEIERLRSELDEERRLNRTLTARLLLGDSTEGSAASSAKSADGQK